MEENVKEVDKLKAEVHDRLKDLREKSNYICGYFNEFAKIRGMTFTVNDTELYNTHIITCVLRNGEKYKTFLINVSEFDCSDAYSTMNKIFNSMTNTFNAYSKTDRNITRFKKLNKEFEGFAKRHDFEYMVNGDSNTGKMVVIFNKYDKYFKRNLDLSKSTLSENSIASFVMADCMSELLGDLKSVDVASQYPTHMETIAKKTGRSANDTVDAYRYAMDAMKIFHKAEANKRINPPLIKDVIFNDPATIVFWTDGTKTVVKCQEGDAFDHEKGITMAFMKKCNGNTGSYCDLIKEWVPVKKKEEEPQHLDIDKTQLDITEE